MGLDDLATLLPSELRQSEADTALQRIRAVLEARSFHAVYQPIVRVRDHRIVGYEALTRFTTHPVQPPNAWFAEAGRVGLQPALETEAAITALAEFQSLPADAYLSLNVSPATLLSGEMLRALRTRPLQRLMLELTEHQVIDNYSELSGVLSPLRQRGLRLAVDDAGAGFASFRHILMLRPDVIKLDASLVRGIHSDRASRALAAALVNFAADTDSEVVAEGVESRAQLDALRNLRVGHVQGYLLGRPEPARLLVRSVATV
jgi:EAL domain-containing protein (putative c-di-GMP-specific phosphodiesterase class I)